MLFKRAMVNKNERGLLLRNGDFQRVLRPGTHWLFGGVDALTVETFALERPALTHALAHYLMAKEPAVVDAEFLQVDLAGTEVGLRRENGVLAAQYGQGDGRQPGRPAPEGAGNAGACGREHRPHLRVRRFRFAAQRVDQAALSARENAP